MNVGLSASFIFEASFVYFYRFMTMVLSLIE